LNKPWGAITFEEINAATHGHQETDETMVNEERERIIRITGNTREKVTLNLGLRNHCRSGGRLGTFESMNGIEKPISVKTHP
jgi:hypothetical protein